MGEATVAGEAAEGAVAAAKVSKVVVGTDKFATAIAALATGAGELASGAVAKPDQAPKQR